MTINATTVQATKSAIEDIFGAKNINKDQIDEFLAVNGNHLMAEELPAETNETVQP